MTTTISFTVNGTAQSITTDPDRPLLDVLREDLHLTGTKYGCGEGVCNACTVLMGGRPVSSCVTPVAKAEGKEITTIEGVAQDGQLHAVQEAFIAEAASQCGYCTPGMVLQAMALLSQKPQPTDDEIVTWMNGNICRCCNYPSIVASVRRAAKTLAEVKA